MCEHLERERIDAAIISGSPKAIELSKVYGITQMALVRHARHGEKSPMKPRAPKPPPPSKEAPRRPVSLMTTDRILTVLEKVRLLTHAGSQAAFDAAAEGELDHLKLLELEAKLSGEMVKQVAATTTVVNAGPRTAEETLAIVDRMRPALAAQVAYERQLAATPKGDK